jgi:hypothetical protein
LSDSSHSKSSSHNRRRRKTRSKKTVSTATNSDDDEVILEQFDEAVKRLAAIDPSETWESEDIQVRAIAEAQKRRSSWAPFYKSPSVKNLFAS